MIEYLASMDENGNSPFQFSGRVETMPPQFNEWIANNADRIEAAEGRGKLPYFLRDNPSAWKSQLEEIKTAQETTETGIDADIAKALGVKKGAPMSFADADTGRENPNYEKDVNNGYNTNCQTCTMTHELRRRGFDVEAKPFNKDFFVKNNWEERFLTADGEKAKRDWSRNWLLEKGYKNMTGARAMEFLGEKLSAPGRYEIYVKWANANSAHVFLAEVGTDGKSLFFCPQTAKDDYTFLTRADKKMLGVMRIDDKKINPKFASLFVSKGGK